MFEVIPAVDIQQGRAVRLYEGDPDRETVYFDDPVEAARHWVNLGARWLHLVDLDAALGRGSNSDIIREIAGIPGVKTEVGGGIRSLLAASQWLELVDRVVLGTAAVNSPELTDALLGRFGPDRVVVSLDARDGLVALRGWTEVSDVPAVTAAIQAKEQGVTTIIYTDVARDGTMLGVDAEPLQKLREVFPHTLLAGGGVASDADLDVYASLGLDGAIVGRALYEGRITYPRTA
jgi:phosphoribosylformimino-5-aminoimidazole carboxamide ribotide isomerase